METWSEILAEAPKFIKDALRHDRNAGTLACLSVYLHTYLLLCYRLVHVLSYLTDFSGLIRRDEKKRESRCTGTAFSRNKQKEET